MQPVEALERHGEIGLGIGHEVLDDGLLRTAESLEIPSLETGNVQFAILNLDAAGIVDISHGGVAQLLIQLGA